MLPSLHLVTLCTNSDYKICLAAWPLTESIKIDWVWPIFSKFYIKEGRNFILLLVNGWSFLRSLHGSLPLHDSSMRVRPQQPSTSGFYVCKLLCCYGTKGRPQEFDVPCCIIVQHIVITCVATNKIKFILYPSDIVYYLLFLKLL